MTTERLQSRIGCRCCRFETSLPVKSYFVGQYPLYGRRGSALGNGLYGQIRQYLDISYSRTGASLHPHVPFMTFDIGLPVCLFIAVFAFEPP